MLVGGNGGGKFTGWSRSESNGVNMRGGGVAGIKTWVYEELKELSEG